MPTIEHLRLASGKGPGSRANCVSARYACNSARGAKRCYWSFWRSRKRAAAAVRVFAPHLATETPRLGRIPPQHQALRGAVKTTIVAVLTAADGAVTTETVARQLLADRKLPLDDPQLRDLFIRRAGQALFTLAKRGTVRKAGQLGRFSGWELVP